MSEPKLISPLLDDFYMGDTISEHDGVRCCPAMERISENKYIVKIISAPASQVQMDALLLSGAYSDRKEALSYFKSVADDVAAETKVLEKLSQLEGFIPYQGYQIIPMDDEGGYDIYLLSPYYRTLERHMRKNPVTHLEAVNLALDMCAALAVCRRCGYLYVDLKPENISVLPDKEFRIADIGFVRLDSLKYASLPDRYRSRYTAPEITDAFSSLNTTLDIYALGTILYQLFNGGQLPTLEEGITLPAPAYADYEISEIILKACAANPEDRWQDPVDMGQAIVSYMQRNGTHDVPIVSVVATGDSAAAEPDGDDSEEATGMFEASQEDTSPEADAPETEDAPEASEPEQHDSEEAEPDADESTEEAAEAILFSEDENGNLTFLIPESDDETAPENGVEEVEYSEITPELSGILAQADDLIAHQVPDPAVAPEPGEVSVTDEEQPQEAVESDCTDDSEEPAPVPTDEAADEQEEPAAEEHAEEASAIEAEEEHPTAVADSEDTDENADITDEPTPSEEEKTDEGADEANDEAPVAADDAEDADSEAEAEEATAEDDGDDEDECEEEDEDAPKKSGRILPAILITLAVLLLLAAGFLFYKFYYLQSVDSLEIDDAENGIVTVLVTSPVPEDQLTVLCIDTYGNQLSSQVLNGKARFSGLAPKTTYTIKVDIKGFHSLTGDTEATLTTPDLTKIIQFQALTGNEDGSVILNITPDGTAPEEWVIRYKDADGNDAESKFSGNILTLSGLSIGTEYTFTLHTDTDLRISGETKVTHVASKIVKPENVRITGCYQGKLGVKWNAPAESEVTSWVVRCYNESGYDKTVTVETTDAAFDIPDDKAAYTVDVTAAGMSVGDRAVAEENSITVGVFEADTSDPTKLVITWKSSTDTAPEGGWIMSYTMDGSAAQEIKCESENTATISPVVPGCKYEFVLRAAAGNTVLGGLYTYEAPAAGKFEGYAVTADNMVFFMCKRPTQSDWDHYDVPDSYYRDEFAIGENAAFVIRMNSGYNTSSDTIVSTFVIRDSAGKIISANSSSSTWTNMWYRNYCEMNIPSLPQTTGQYTISVYFNNALVNENSFTIVN